MMSKPVRLQEVVLPPAANRQLTEAEDLSSVIRVIHQIQQTVKTPPPGAKPPPAASGQKSR